MVGGSGGGSQRLLCLNPTTVMVVLLLGLLLLLGCDNKNVQTVEQVIFFFAQPFSQYEYGEEEVKPCLNQFFNSGISRLIFSMG